MAALKSFGLRRGPLSPWGPVVKEVEIGQAPWFAPALLRRISILGRAHDWET